MEDTLNKYRAGDRVEIEIDILFPKFEGDSIVGYEDKTTWHPATVTGASEFGIAVSHMMIKANDDGISCREEVENEIITDFSKIRGFGGT